MALKSSIRDVLVLTALVAVSIGWFLDRRALAKQDDELQATAQLWEYRAGAVADGVSGDGWRVNLDARRSGGDQAGQR